MATGTTWAQTQYNNGGGTGTFDCPNLEANFGEECNDGDPYTVNDVIVEGWNTFKV